MSESRPDNANEECVGPASEMAGKATSCEGCPAQQDCASGKNAGPDPAAAEVAEGLKDVRHKLLILSGKGGVGKSTFSAQLAWTLSHAKKQIGLLDIDICGPSIPRMMGVEKRAVHRSNLGWTPVYVTDQIGVMSVGFMLQKKDDAIIWRGPRKNGLIKQFLVDVIWGDADFLIVDAPPGTSDEHISIVKYLDGAKADGAVIITTPQEVSLLDVRKEINFCKKVGLRVLGVVENMSGFICPCCQTKSDIFAATSGGAVEMCKEMGVPFLGSIPLDPDILKCCEKGISFVNERPGSPAAAAYHQVVEALMRSTPEIEETWRRRDALSDSESDDESSPVSFGRGELRGVPHC